MTFQSVSKFISTTLAWTAAGAAIGGAEVAASTALGAAVLDKSGYDDYSASRAAYTGFMGGVVIGGACGFLYGLVSACTGKLPTPSGKEKSTLTIAVGGNVLSALTGHGILTSSSALGLGQTAAASVVGSAILIPSAALVLGCGVGCAALCWADAQANPRDPRPAGNNQPHQIVRIDPPQDDANA